jgi:hypothetical protein
MDIPNTLPAGTAFNALPDLQHRLDETRIYVAPTRRSSAADLSYPDTES